MTTYIKANLDYLRNRRIMKKQQDLILFQGQNYIKKKNHNCITIRNYHIQYYTYELLIFQNDNCHAFMIIHKCNKKVHAMYGTDRMILTCQS